ncbi:MAG: protein of unknown function transrane [Gemmatimonadetes bacterium]|nr:protein of unknown function transrane [Gemmatimonadota bacterium]
MFRAVLGLALAACIAFLARRTRSLTTGGAIAATLVGGVAIAAGWSWGALLIIYFVSSTILSRVGRDEKELRTASLLAKGGERDAVQVLANGAVFAGAALAMVARPDVHWMALGAGSLAASAADTWATEVGTLRGGEPRSIFGGRRVPPGTSGAVSVVGTMAAVSGAAFVAAAAIALGWPPHIARYVLLGGIFGALADSVLGATMQARRWCEACGSETERTTHDCGSATRPLRGLGWLDNDVVNFLSNAAGGLLAALLTR